MTGRGLRGARNGSTGMIDQSERHGIYDHNGFGQTFQFGKGTQKRHLVDTITHATKTGLIDSISYSITDESDQTIYDIHKWTIAPTGGEKVLLVFSEFAFYSAEVIIEDSSGVLFSCASCGAGYVEPPIPPPFESTDGSVSITAFGAAGVSFSPSNFVLQYVSRHPSADSDLSDITLEYNMGYAHITPVLLSGGLLQAGCEQEYRVNTSTGAIGPEIVFTLADFTFPADCTSSLTIYDSYDVPTRNLIFSGCQSSDATSEWLYSRTSLLAIYLDNTGRATDETVSFTLDYMGEKDLFQCGSISIQQPDLLRASSGFLIDGSTASSIMRGAQSCEWLIQPSVASTGATLTLLLHRVSLKYGSSVKVYDGSGTSDSRLLWDSGQAHFYGGFAGASSVVPPPITSSGSSLYVVYKSSSLFGGGSIGFYGEYYSNTDLSLGIGNEDGEYLHMSTALGLSIPGDKLAYTGGVNYTWNIRPTDITAGSVLNFALTALYVPSASDELVLYEGRAIDEAAVLGRWGAVTTSLPTQWYQTSGQEAMLVFRSQGAGSGASQTGNFKMSYFTDGPNFHCGYPTDPIELEASSFTFTDGSSSVEQIYRNQSCKWIIDPPGTNGIYVFFTRFNVIGGSLDIYQGNDFAEDDFLFSIDESDGVPAPFYVDRSQMGVHYRSGSTDVQGTGFSATYFRVPVDKDLAIAPGDDAIRLSSCSMLSLSHVASHGYIAPTTDSVYLVRPNTTSTIYFFLAQMNLSACHGVVTIYDGPDISYPSLGSYCGESSVVTPNWVYTSGNTATITFVSDGEADYHGNFDISYYSNGNTNHCGFQTNPGTLNAHSMIFSDGTHTNETIFDNQHCEWLISPLHDLTDAGTGAGSTSGSYIVLELLRMDLRGGGILEVYDGASTEGSLVWRCRYCTVVPKPFVLRSGNGYIRYRTDFAAYEGSLEGPWANPNITGTGFKASYWTFNSSQLTHVMPEDTSLNGSVLESPPGFTLPAETFNYTRHWYLGTGEWTQRLRVHPRLGMESRESDGGSVGGFHSWQDGRLYSNPGDFQALANDGIGTQYCGTVFGNVSAVLLDDQSGIVMAATQHAGAYVQSRVSGKSIYNLYGSWDLSKETPTDAVTSPVDVCKYIVDSGSTQSLTIRVKRQQGLSESRLRVYTGLYGYDFTAYDSRGVGSGSGEASFRAYCGRATILLERNSSLVGAGSTIDHGFEIEYEARKGDACAGEICPDCRWYIDSLIPDPPFVDVWLPYRIALYACLGACCLFFSGLYIRKLMKKYVPEGGWVRLLNPFGKIKIYKVVTPRHLKYTPKWDNFRNNWLLPVGECAICQEKTLVFKFKPCNHAMCVEDMHGYISNALGDISQFPIKCPLHYEGCTTVIEAKLAKRVLDKNAFDKYNEFSDRVAYGEGMRCIFCNNYVNFPEEGGLNMVECPYCVQHFCIRCKKPWHFESKCPLEGVDDSLDKWRDLSGAQKCPACLKLIEKSDVETCNHMIHKITDGIPCIRDRTDFCYCCGEEVLGDYPHEEVNHPGVNHFPDGVYQKCRTAQMKEREAERERLKRLRRMKGGNVKREQSFDLGGDVENSKDGGVDEDGWEKIPEHLLRDNPGSGSGGGVDHSTDYFDTHWDAEVGSKPSSSSPSSASSPNASPDRKSPNRRLSSVPARLPTLSPVPARIPANQSGGGGRGSRASPNPGNNPGPGMSTPMNANSRLNPGGSGAGGGSGARQGRGTPGSGRGGGGRGRVAAGR